MEEKKPKTQEEQGQGTGAGNGAVMSGQEEGQKRSSVSETWAEETIADLDDFIESQGIYIRQ